MGRWPPGWGAAALALWCGRGRTVPFHQHAGPLSSPFRGGCDGLTSPPGFPLMQAPRCKRVTGQQSSIPNRPANRYYLSTNRSYRPINWSQPFALASSFEKLNFDRFPLVTGPINRYQTPVTWPETVLKTLLIVSIAA
jgi:hypothetical protein